MWSFIDERQIMVKGKTRNWRIELMRLFSMFLIVATHFFASANWEVRTDASRSATWAAAAHNSFSMFGQVGVTIFVLISAFFLSSSSGSPFTRCLKLWIQTFFYSAGILFLVNLGLLVANMPSELNQINSWHNIVASLFPILFGTYWFLSAFFIMTLAVPLLNKLLNSLDARLTRSLIFLLVFITFIWKYINPNIAYFTDVCYFVTLYVIGASIRRYKDLIPKINLFMTVGTVIFCYLICVIGTHILSQGYVFTTSWGYPGNLFTAGPGASPIFAVVAGTILFVWIIQKPDPENEEGSLGKVINFVSPATLGIYLIHENFIVKQWLWNFVFRNPEPVGMLNKAVFAFVTIIVVYIALLSTSLILEKLIITPLSNLIISHSNRIKKNG
jgi:surface polysaccharide O-acyltransferase-like enzyme